MGKISLKYVISAGLVAAFLVLSVQIPLTKQADAAAKPVTVSVNQNGEAELSNPPFIENGATLVPLREISSLLNSNTIWIPEGKRIVINNPAAKIELSLGSKDAVVNGKPYKLAAVPNNKKGVVFVPARFIAEALGAKVDWDPIKRNVHLSYENKFLYAEKEANGYWLDRKSGELFMSANGQEAKLVADTNAEIVEYAEMTVDLLSSNVIILNVHDNYGEPHIHNNIYRFVIVDGQLAKESNVYYAYHQILSLQKTDYGHAILMDGAVLYEIDKSGGIAASYDLQKITGYEDTSFQVEYYDDEIAVVRPHMTGWLTLINRSTKEAVRLADVLLSEEKLEIYRSMSNDPTNTVFDDWEGLHVKERAGDELKLTHYYFIDDSTTELTYKLASTKVK